MSEGWTKPVYFKLLGIKTGDISGKYCIQNVSSVVFAGTYTLSIHSLYLHAREVLSLYGFVRCQLHLIANIIKTRIAFTANNKREIRVYVFLEKKSTYENSALI